MTIAVGAAGKVGDGVNAYYVYTVTSEMFSVEPIHVDRRYSDFLWLHTQLSRQCAGFIIPPLPAKVVPLLQDEEFLERRRAGLEKFLRKVVEHDELKNTNYFKSFLECSPVELTAIKQEAQRQENGGANANATGTALSQMAQKSQQLNSWWGKAYQRMAENDKVRLLAAKAGRDLNSGTVIEDHGFDKLLNYVTELNALVKTMQARAQAAHKQNKLAAGAYCELIESMSAIADVEESSPSGSSTASSDFGAVLSALDTRARLIDIELAEFSEAVDYFARWVGAVVNAVNVREDRRYVYQAKLAARGTSTNNNNASRELVEAKEEFERIHTRVVSEVKRFQAEKSIELRRIFGQYTKVLAQSTTELTEVVMASERSLAHPVATKTFSGNRFISATSTMTASNQNEDNDEVEHGLNKIDIREQEASPPKRKPSHENADLYSDVCL